MLVLSRKVGEKLVIGEGIVVQVLAVRRGQIRLGIEAPRSVPVRRDELPVFPGGAGAGGAGARHGPHTSRSTSAAAGEARR